MDLFNFVIYMIYYPLVVAMFILCCFADAPPTFREIDEHDEVFWSSLNMYEMCIVFVNFETILIIVFFVEPLS